MKNSVYQLIIKRRSIRRFKPEKVPYQVLEKAVNAGRVAPSARNLQPLEYIIVDDQDLLPKMFSLVRFAGYLDWNPEPEEMPRAYIAILAREEDAYTKYDIGLAAENIILTCLEEGIGSCPIMAFNEKGVREVLDVPSNYSIQMLLALGYPAEDPIMEDLESKDASTKYWKDNKGILHVPKRALTDILHRNKFGKK